MTRTQALSLISTALIADIGIAVNPRSAAAQTEISASVSGRIYDINPIDELGDNAASPARVGDELGVSSLQGLQEDRAVWEFNIDPVRQEILDAVDVFFEVTVTDKSDPLGSGDALLNFRLHAVEGAGEDGLRSTFDYQAPASPVGPVFVFADVAPSDRLSVRVTNAAKQDAQQAGSWSAYRFQVLQPQFVGDGDTAAEYAEFDNGMGADPKLVIYGVGDPLPPRVPALGAAGVVLLSALTLAFGALALRARARAR